MKFLLYFIFVFIGVAFSAPAPEPRKPGKMGNGKYYLIETADEPKDGTGNFTKQALDA